MLRNLVLTSTLATAAAWGETAPAFEVATVRPSNAAPSGNDMARHVFGNATIQVSADGVIMRNATLRTITRWAYHVPESQVTGADWTSSDQFDVTAKAAGAVGEDQLRTMMRALLADRFKMAMHRQTKEMQTLLLQPAKGVVKVKESAGDGEAEIGADARSMSLNARHAGIGFLVDALANLFHAPVIDQTGLTGKYDVTINFTKYMMDAQSAGAAGAPPDPQSMVNRALQEEVGLKLDARKMPVEMIVIDRAEKLPVAN